MRQFDRIIAKYHNRPRHFTDFVVTLRSANLQIHLVNRQRAHSGSKIEQGTGDRAIDILQSADHAENGDRHGADNQLAGVVMGLCCKLAGFAGVHDGAGSQLAQGLAGLGIGNART